MLHRTSLLGVTLAALIGAAATAGCSHERTASAEPPPPNTMALAQGDAVGRALLVPTPAQAPETATAQVDLSPADE